MRPTPSTALLVVDVQPDFLPGGALAVAEGDRVVQPIRRLLESRRFRHVVATQDWHPAGHASFASSHAGRAPFDTITLHGHEQVLWPDHCVQGTPGAALCPEIRWDALDAVIRKGTDPGVDSYSGFRNNWNEHGARPPTGLAGYLRERGVDAVWISGLARDFCIRWSAEDARAAGFDTTVLWDLTRSVDPSGDEPLRRALEQAGVRVADGIDPG